jgi:hypothetical protein
MCTLMSRRTVSAPGSEQLMGGLILYCVLKSAEFVEGAIVSINRSFLGIQ